MPIQCPLESVGVGFLAIAAVDSKKGQDWLNTKQKSMRQTIYWPQPLSTYHFILHSYEPNKQCLMDEMPIQRPWESVGVGFLAIAAVDPKNVQDWSKSQPKSMRQTIYRSQPLTTYHFILRSYEPNKQCLMDEMPIQCPWESVWVGFLAIGAVDS
jgi:hypothetical protein